MKANFPCDMIFEFDKEIWALILSFIHLTYSRKASTKTILNRVIPEHNGGNFQKE